MRVLCLVDGPVVPPDRWMWNHLPQSAQADEVEFLWASPADRFPKWGKLISYYPQYLMLGIRAIQACRRKRFDVITAWESKTGFLLGSLRSVLGVHTPPLVIFAFSFKGIAASVPAVSRLAMRGIDHITVLSPEEVNYYSQILHFSTHKITVCQFGWHDLCKGISPVISDDFIFSYGRSYRDYGTLFDAIDGLRIKVVVNTRRFALKNLKIPSNVIINEMMPEREYAQLLVSARFLVLPLLDTRHAAGESAIVQAMAAGKAIIATRTHSTPYYIEDGVTGILTPPNDAVAMRDACIYLLNNPDVCVAMGIKSRQRYEALYTSEHAAQCQYSVMQRVMYQTQMTASVN